MNKVMIVAVCFTFAVGAIIGRMTVAPAEAAVVDTQVHPMEMMKSAYALPEWSFDAI